MIAIQEWSIAHPLITVIIACLISITIVMILSDFARRKKRQRWLDCKTCISNSQFAKAICLAHEDMALFIIIRNAVAQMCRLPPEMLGPDDETKDIEMMMFPDGYDEVNFLMTLEGLAGSPLHNLKSLPAFVMTHGLFRRRVVSKKFGVWIGELISYLTQQRK